jgi:hypothetical protein
MTARNRPSSTVSRFAVTSRTATTMAIAKAVLYSPTMKKDVVMNTRPMAPITAASSTGSSFTRTRASV